MPKKPPRQQPTREVLTNIRYNAARRVANSKNKTAKQKAADKQAYINADRAVKRHDAGVKPKKKVK